MSAQATPATATARHLYSDAFISGCDPIGARYTLIVRAEKTAHFLHRLHPAKKIGIAELDRGSGQKFIQFGGELFRQVGGFCHLCEVHIPGDPIAFESEGHDRPAL